MGMGYQAPHNEWDELCAAQRSEAELAQKMHLAACRASKRELERARRDALKAMVRDLPDPGDVADTLLTVYPEAAEVLRQAWISSKQPYAGTWRVADCPEAAVLRSLGLVGWIGKGPGMGCCVGNFGLIVRQALLGNEKEERG